MMSLMSFLQIFGVGIKGSAHKTGGLLGLVWEFGSVVLACSSVSSSGKPETLKLGYLSASRGVEL